MASGRTRRRLGVLLALAAFALLFLLRSPSVFHPTAPTEMDSKPRGETTPSDPPKAPMGG